MATPLGYLGGSFGKVPKQATAAQHYLREKAALMTVQRYYAAEEFEQLMADVTAGLVNVRIYEDGIVLDRNFTSGLPGAGK